MQKIKAVFMVIASCIVLPSCTTNTKPKESTSAHHSIVGTWRLISGTVIAKGDTTITYYTQGRSFIKIINDTHFAFLLHDLNGGKDTTAVFSSGGGTYTVSDSVYTEHLEYCSDRSWEGHKFTFTIAFKNDTLIQKGIEEIKDTGVRQWNTERYVRFTPKVP
jgi:hypothetical protein